MKASAEFKLPLDTTIKLEGDSKILEQIIKHLDGLKLYFRYRGDGDYENTVIDIDEPNL